MRLPQASSFDTRQNGALRWYLAALLVFGACIAEAVRHYPGPYDWVYTVATALASPERNPEGRVWMAGAVCLGVAALWLCVAALDQRLRASDGAAGRFAIVALRLALACFALLGAEALLNGDLSRLVFKGHELLALAGFVSAYLGILSLLARLVLRQRLYTLPALLVVSPLLAIGITQLWLYFEQRGLGWVRPDWRAMGIPIWLSFAFWQWLAIGFLWAGLGLLVLVGSSDKVAS